MEKFVTIVDGFYLLTIRGFPSRSSRPEVFCKKGSPINFTEFSFFPVNFVKFLRTLFYIEHLWWLLLSILHV